MLTHRTLEQGLGACGTRAKCGPPERLIWPTSEFLLPNLEYKIALVNVFFC